MVNEHFISHSIGTESFVHVKWSIASNSTTSAPSDMIMDMIPGVPGRHGVAMLVCTRIDTADFPSYLLLLALF